MGAHAYSPVLGRVKCKYQSRLQRQTESIPKIRAEEEEGAWGEDGKGKGGCHVSGEVYTEKIWGKHPRQ